MCLIVDKKQTLKDKKRGTFTAYKVYAKCNQTLETLYYGSGPEKPGDVVAEDTMCRKVKMYNTCPRNGDSINAAIHVFKTKRGAEHLAESDNGFYTGYRIVVPVKCRGEDVIGSSANESKHPTIALTQVTITQQTWDNIFKKRTKKRTLKIPPR